VAESTSGAQALEASMNCPNCNHGMIRLSARSFSCTPCRQTVRVYPVAQHRFLRSIELDDDAILPLAGEARAVPSGHQISA
jgi:hypothetical protein